MIGSLSQIFTQILSLNLVGSYIILLVLAARVLLRKSPRWCSYLLWGIVFIRLILPVFPESDFSLIPAGLQRANHVMESLAEHTVDGTQINVTPDTLGQGNPDGTNGGPVSQGTGTSEGAVVNGMNNSDANNTGTANAGTANAGTVDESSLLSALSLVWVIGTICFGIYHIRSYYALKKQVKSAMPAEAGVYEIRGEHLSFVLGIFRPAIYLSGELDEASRKVVLCHEQVHLKRKDYLIKPMALAIACIHWFNPLVWLAFYLMSKDCEISCDEKVIAILGEESKKIYSYALLDEATRGQRHHNRQRNACAVLSFGEDGIKNRIKHVLNFKKAPAWLLVCTVILLVVLVLGLCSNSSQQRDDGNSNSETLEETSTDETATDETLGTEDISTEETIAGEETAEDETGEDETGEEETEEVPSKDTYVPRSYEEIITDNQGNQYQFSEQGIYALNVYGESTEDYRCIYPEYVPEPVRVWLWEDKLYFPTASEYPDDAHGNVGTVDWVYDSICRIDMLTGEYKYIPLPKENVKPNQWEWLSVHSGFVFINDGDGVALADAEAVWEGKTVFELSDAEKDAYGTYVRDYLLQHPGEILRLGNRNLELTTAVIDMNGDGGAEEISIIPGKGKMGSHYYPYDYYDLQMSEYVEKGRYANSLNNEIWAFSPDGEEIYVALYEDGPSGDPLTTIFGYEDGKLAEAGTIGNEIEKFRIADGVISTYERKDIVQTDFLKLSFVFVEGKLAQVVEDTYDFEFVDDISLVKELTLHTAPDSEETFVLQPQTVRLLKTDTSMTWVYLEAENGQTGWFQMTEFGTVYGQLSVFELFENLFMAG